MTTATLNRTASARREVLKIGSKPTPRTAASAPIAAEPARLVPSAPELCALGKLRRAQENVRHTRIDEDCEPLADDIAAHGLLQSLIGYRDGDYIEVVGGGRRLKALRIVRDRGLIDDSFLVPVLIRDVDEAVELSLAENLQQRTMSPVDEFFAFSKLMEAGTSSEADLAKRFGFSERVVKQRLRLANLARPVLDALADRQITLDAAMAYATSQDTALQVEVFEVQSKRGRTAHEPTTIRHSLRLKGIDTADRLYRFVGADRYERDGGTYEDDLFIEAGKDRVLTQPFLVETIANTMVDFQAARLVEQLRDNYAWAPTIAGFVKVPDLRVHAWGTSQKLRSPAGFVLVEREEPDRLWRTVKNNGWKVHIVVGLDEAGELVPVRRYAFVPIGQKSAVEKPALIDKAEDNERSATAEREREIIRWSRRLAVGPFAGTPFEGRAHWPELNSDRHIPATVAGVDGFMVPVFIFVTDAEIAAQRKAAVAEADRRLAERAAGGTS